MVSLSPVAIDTFLTGDDDPAVVMLNHLCFDSDGGAPAREHNLHRGGNHLNESGKFIDLGF
ncbi:hypothetical protein ACVWY2_000579 [Bradyrhizobium sp. JR6.1]